MLSSQRLKSFLFLKELTRAHFPIPKAIPFASTLSLKYSSITSEQHSFTVSYLINNCAFSPETALKASKLVRFENAEKPDSVIAFFRNNGFTNAQINSIIRNGPNVLTCNLHKRVLPKFEFLRSKSASNSDIVDLVNSNPRILYASLENSIIPAFESVRRFLPSDKKTIDCIIACRHFFGHDLVVKNVRLLLDDGIKDSNITYVLCRRPSIILSRYMRKDVDEVKEMGFDPSELNFAIALQVKRGVSKSRWDAKVEAFKGWGWTEEMVLNAFRKRPLCMLASKDKINEVMKFWVNELGWNPLVLVERSEIFGYSLEKRIIPRGLVFQYLLANGLIKRNASLSTLFAMSEKMFLEKYVKCFREEKCQLLKLYQEKRMVTVFERKEDGAASGSYEGVNL
ncbi:uncharacterized protein LOC113852271 [Abrus precatorius]|uniref:Uncharacterized protein LOC113852271 n=1 Tax=Abrus precatorius TaxID=3816 RepID=A0A8B8K4R8_ABRPR|nr:uncharacterized protein LOC113852271 [Abrus precatorius]